MANDNNNQQRPASPPQPIQRYRWIINNQERRLGFPLPPVYSQQSKASTPDATPLQLIPGCNLVECKRWDAIKKADPDREVDGDKIPGEITRLLTTEIPDGGHANRRPQAAGKMHLVEGPLVANHRDPLGGMGESEAAKFVDGMRFGVSILGTSFNETVLRGLIQIEKRPSVSAALHKALDIFERGAARQAI